MKQKIEWDINERLGNHSDYSYEHINNYIISPIGNINRRHLIVFNVKKQRPQKIEVIIVKELPKIGKTIVKTDGGRKMRVNSKELF